MASDMLIILLQNKRKISNESDKMGLDCDLDEIDKGGYPRSQDTTGECHGYLQLCDDDIDNNDQKDDEKSGPLDRYKYIAVTKMDVKSVCKHFVA